MNDVLFPEASEDTADLAQVLFLFEQGILLFPVFDTFQACFRRNIQDEYQIRFYSETLVEPLDLIGIKASGSLIGNG